MRSRMPPCPGSRVPESFTPTERLSADSARSPTCAATLTITARMSQYHQTSSAYERATEFQRARYSAMPSNAPTAIMLPATEAIEPSHVLLGLRVGASL